jgi:hypothetical protein
MKRLFLTTAMLAALGAGCGQGTGATGAPDSADLLVRWHFAGTAALAGDTNAAALRTVLAQPSTRAVLTQALSRLTLAPETKPLAPFLNDLLVAESFVEARGEAARPDWTFALRLPPDRAGLWLTNWTAAAAAWQRPNAQAITAGDWVVAAVGGEQLPGLAAVRARLAKTGRPGVQAEPGAWFELEANLPRLAPALGLPASVSWPHAHFAWAGRGQNIRTAARFRYDQPLELPLEPWHLPTNTVREPLLSFTAVQGVRPWLAAQPVLAELSLPAPNQVFSWAKSPAPYETLFAWELADAPAWIQAAQAKLKPALKSRLPWLDFGEVRFVTNLNRLLWQGFPIIVPFVNPAPDPGFVVAGIFPVVSRKEAAPAELYDQFRGRTNLVLYDWEITQPRLGNWQALGMLHGMLARYTPPATNTPARLWLQDTNVTRHLGNTVTELTRVSPRELAGVRTSAIGFTAFELQWLARWLDGSRFPHLTPPERPANRTRPAARGTTNAPSPRP